MHSLHFDSLAPQMHYFLLPNARLHNQVSQAVGELLVGGRSELLFPMLNADLLSNISVGRRSRLSNLQPTPGDGLPERCSCCSLTCCIDKCPSVKNLTFEINGLCVFCDVADY